MSSKKTLKELVAKKQILAPCVWDCMSARIAQECGFEAILLSGATFANATNGFPDIGIVTADDVVRAADRVCSYSDLPCIIDTDDAFGETSVHAYRTIKRLVNAGAMAFTLDDTTGVRGFERWFMAMRNQEMHIEHPVVSREVWLSKIKAALDATSGTDCMCIARTEAKVEFGLEEAMERANLARELGAPMTLIIGISTEEEAEVVSRNVPGWKMWPDVMSRNGKPDAELPNLAKQGFNLVTCHIFEKGAMNGMYEMGIRTLADGNTVYHDLTEMKMQYMDSKIMHWLEKESRFNDLSELRR